MNFSMRNFIKNGFLNAIGKMGDYWVILNAAGWFDKGVLLEADLIEIQAAIDARNATHTPENTPSEPEEPASENEEPASEPEEPVSA